MKLLRPKLTLVGAGPGDIELITVKGVKSIQNADVILYDALVDKKMLDYARKETIAICVGKRADRPSFHQNDINQLILKYCRRYPNVVRLKGGDPFVFGRGHEEIAFAQAHNIETEVIPGISSALAVPSSIGIPVTSRGVSQSVWVMTGTRSNLDIGQDIAIASKSSATLVILMGIKKINVIVSICLKHLSPSTPIAVIRSGTLDESSHIIGSLDDILIQLAAQRHSGPGIIVIGDVVSLANGNELESISQQYCQYA